MIHCPPSKLNTVKMVMLIRKLMARLVRVLTSTALIFICAYQI